MNENNAIILPFIMVLFPSITFSLLHAEIFPWGIIFYTCCLLITRNMRLELLFILLILFTFSTVGIINSGGYKESIRSLFAYLNAILAFFGVISLSYEAKKKMISVSKTIMIIMILIGILQHFDLVPFMDHLLPYLMQRGGSSAFDSARGVSILSSEPSRAAFEIIFIYLVFRCFNYNSGNHIVLDLLIAIFLVVVIKSVTGLAVFSIFILIDAIVNKKTWLIPPITIVIISTIVLIQSGKIDTNEIRALYVINRIIESVNIQEAFEIILRESGFRVISVISAFLYGSYSIIGSGIGNWESSSLEALSFVNAESINLSFFLNTCGNQICSVRSSSFLSALTLDIGIVFSVIFTILLMSSTKVNEKNKQYIIFFYVLLITLSTVGNPVAWVCTGLISSFGEKENEK